MQLCSPRTPHDPPSRWSIGDLVWTFIGDVRVEPVYGHSKWPERTCDMENGCRMIRCLNRDPLDEPTYNHLSCLELQAEFTDDPGSFVC